MRVTFFVAAATSVLGQTNSAPIKSMAMPRSQHDADLNLAMLGATTEDLLTNIEGTKTLLQRIDDSVYSTWEKMDHVMKSHFKKQYCDVIQN